MIVSGRGILFYLYSSFCLKNLQHILTHIKSEEKFEGGNYLETPSKVGLGSFMGFLHIEISKVLHNLIEDVTYVAENEDVIAQAVYRLSEKLEQISDTHVS